MTDNCSGTNTLVSSSQLSRPWRQRNQRKVCVGISFFPWTSIRVSQAVPPATTVFDNSRSQRQLWHPLRRHSPAIPRDVKAAKNAPTPYKRSQTNKVPGGTCVSAAVARGSSPSSEERRVGQEG